MAAMRAFVAARQNAARRNATPASSTAVVEAPPPVDERGASAHAGTRRPLEDTPVRPEDGTPPAKKAKVNNTVVSTVLCVHLHDAD